MPILVWTDPDIGPRRRDDERAKALQRIARPNHFAIGADVREAASVAMPANSRQRIGDISQARRSGRPYVFVNNGLAQLSSSAWRARSTRHRMITSRAS